MWMAEICLGQFKGIRDDYGFTASSHDCNEPLNTLARPIMPTIWMPLHHLRLIPFNIRPILDGPNDFTGPI